MPPTAPRSWLLAAIVVAGQATVAHAQPAYEATVSTDAGARALLTGPGVSVYEQDSPGPNHAISHNRQPVTSTTTATATALDITFGNGIASGFAMASVSPGRISVYAAASGAGSFTAAGTVAMAGAGSGDAWARGQLFDTLVFDVGLPYGTPLLVDASFLLHGHVSFTQNLVGGANNSGSIGVSFSARLNYPWYSGSGFDIPFQSASSFLQDGVIWGHDPGLFRTYDLRQTLVFAGMPAQLSLYAAVSTAGSGSVSCWDGCAIASVGGVSALADLSRTLSWQGVSAVTLFDGTPLPLSSLSITSASGFDYTQAATPVPEPATALLALVGALAVTGAARRRRLAARSEEPAWR